MPLRTVGPFGKPKPDPDASFRVGGRSDCLELSRIHSRTLAAEMVYLPPSWELANECLIRPAMREHSAGATGSRERPVTVMVAMRSPEPAARGWLRRHLLPEAVERRLAELS